MSTEQDVAEVRRIIVDQIEQEFLVSFEEDGLDNDSDLFTAGILDSFAVVNLVVLLETQFGVKFTPNDMASSKVFSIVGLADLVVAKQREASAS